MHRTPLTMTDLFVHEKGGRKHSFLSGRQLRRLTERRLKKLGLQRSDFGLGMSINSTF